MDEYQIVDREFQSLIGRLQTDINSAYLSVMREFQSLIGRLQTGRTEALRGDVNEFQSLIGRLQTRLHVLLPFTFCCFNPS